jgi:hypothetical protein
METTSSNGWIVSWLSPLWTLTTFGWVDVCGVWWVVENTVGSLCNLFGYILMLFIDFSLLCCIHVWCIHRFISHTLHLLFILFSCMFLSMLMFNLFYLFFKTSNDYFRHLLKSTGSRKALALFLNIKLKWLLPIIKKL